MATSQYAVNFTQRKPTRSVEEALSEIERELRVRERCYAGWVESGKLTRIDAIDRLERMTSAWLHLDKLLSLQQPETVPDSEASGEGVKESI